MQNAEIRKLKGESTAVGVDTNNQLEELVEDLLVSKRRNIELRLSLDVLAKKVVGDNVVFVKGKTSVGMLDYEKEFPALSRNEQSQDQQKRTWASVAEGNCSKTAGVSLEYVEPLVVNGVKCVSYLYELQLSLC